MLLIKATIPSAIIRFMQKVARTAADAKKPMSSIQVMPTVPESCFSPFYDPLLPRSASSHVSFRYKETKDLRLNPIRMSLVENPNGFVRTRRHAIIRDDVGEPFNRPAPINAPNLADAESVSVCNATAPRLDPRRHGRPVGPRLVRQN